MNIKFEIPPVSIDSVSIDTEWSGMRDGHLHRPEGTFACMTLNFHSDPDTVYFIQKEEDVAPALANCQGTWVIMNAMFDLFHLRRLAPISPRPVRDIMLMEKSLWSGYYSDFSLQDLVRRYFGVLMDKGVREEFFEIGEMTPEKIEYAAMDTIWNTRVYQKQCELMNEKQWKIHDEVDMPVVWSTLDYKGFALDSEAWVNLAKENRRKAQEIEDTLDFNPRSPQQVKIALSKAGVNVPSTGKEVLQHYQHVPVVQKIQECRNYSKMASTYGEKWIEEWVEEGRINAGWSINGTETGRRACSNPPLQTIPARKTKDFRKCFIAGPEHVLIIADYSAQEPRMLAYLSKDPEMLRIVLENGDIHTEAAKIIFQNPNIQKKDRERKLAKSLNLGLSYGLTPQGLMEAEDLIAAGVHLNEEEAQHVVDLYFNAFYGIRDYITNMRAFAREHEYVETIMGRRIWVNLNSYQWQNNAINAPIQGGSADMSKLAEAKFHRTWLQHPEWGPFGMVAPIHDEIVVEASEWYVDEIKTCLVECMESVAEEMCPGIPFKADAAVGRSWADKE